MEQRNLGRSGLIVSAVGLGCNNFGGRMDMAATRAVVHKALDLGDHVFRHRRHLWRARRLARNISAARWPDRRHDIVLATKFARPMDRDGPAAGRLAPLYHAGRRGQPPAARHRLYRPLLPAHRRPADADRGDAARARRSRAAGQGPLYRLLVAVGLAGRRGAMDLDASRAGRALSPARSATTCWSASSTRR